MLLLDKRHRSYYLAIRSCPSLLYQFFANEIAEGFRPSRIAAIGDVVIKFVQQIGIDRDTYPAQLPHGRKVAHGDVCDGF